MRRPAALVAALAVAALTVAAPAAGETATFDGNWNGSTVTLTSAGGGLQIRAEVLWQRPPLVVEPSDFRVGVVVTGHEREDCPLPPDSNKVGPAEQRASRLWGASLAYDLSFTCNGTYELLVDVQAYRGRALLDTAFRPMTVAVANPPGTPKDVTAKRSNSGKVTLTWAAPSGTSAPDFTGYLVERTVDGTTTTLGAEIDALTFVDDDVELGPGDEATYRVKATRRGATEGSSVASSAATATVSVPQPTPTTESPETTDPDGTGDDGDPDEGGEEGQDPGVGEAGSGSGPVAMPRTGSGRPPVGPMRPVTPTTIDTGYQESLPFDPDRMTGPRDAVLPDDELASLIFDEGDGGAGLAVPGATAAVLAVWALHLRHLNRLARTDP